MIQAIATLGFLTICLPLVHGAGTDIGILMASPFKTFIQKASVSLKVPSTPNPQKDLVNIFPSLVALHWYHSPTISSYGTPSSYQCSAGPGEWCAYATIFDYNQQKTTKGAIKVVKPGDLLQYSIEQVPGQFSYVETISRSGQILSQTTGGEETAVFFYLRSECYKNAANIPAYTWSNLSLTMALQYPNFAKEATIQKSGATTTPLYTNDGGLTWKIDTISVPAVSCTL